MSHFVARWGANKYRGKMKGNKDNTVEKSTFWFWLDLIIIIIILFATKWFSSLLSSNVIWFMENPFPKKEQYYNFLYVFLALIKLLQVKGKRSGIPSSILDIEMFCQQNFRDKRRKPGLRGGDQLILPLISSLGDLKILDTWLKIMKLLTFLMVSYWSSC